MLKRKCVYLLFVISLFVVGECFYLPLRNKEFSMISTSIKVLKENNILNKEEQMQDAYNFDDYLDYDVEYSKILFRNIYDFADEITIYKGSDYNIKKNYLVINKDGLVGVVTNVNKNTSKVQLLNNKNTSLSVKVNNYYGILKCINNVLIIEGIDNKSLINIGDIITTSDISIYPEDIIVGRVKSVNYDKYEIEQLIIVEPVVDFDSISYIGIIKSLRGVQ